MTKTDRVCPSGVALLLLGFMLTGSAAMAADPTGLLASLKSPRRLERVAAAWELGEMRETSAVATLAAALEDQHAGVRLWAARSLVKVGAPAVEPLLAVLGRQDLKEGLASDYLIPALGELKDPRALPALVRVVVRGKDRDFQAHQEYRAAITALAGFGSQAFDPLLAALRLMDHPPPGYNRRNGLFEALGNTKDPRAVDAILGAVAKGYSPEITADPAPRALGKLRDPRAVDFLIKLLLERDGWPNTDAAWALGEIGDTRTVEPLIAAATRSRPGTGIWDKVIAPLGKTQDPRAVAALLGMMSQAGSGMIPFALAAAGPATLQAAPSALQDPNANVRSAMAAALGEMTDAAAVPLLISTLGDTAVDVRAAAYQGLERKGLKDRGIADLLVQALSRPGTELRSSVSKLLLMLTPSGVTPELVAALGDDNPEVRKNILGVLSRLTLKDPGYSRYFITASQDPDAGLRRWACLYLGGRKDPAAIESLILRLKDEAPAVRAMAARSLGMIGDDRAREPLFSGVQDVDREASTEALLALAALKDMRAIAPLFDLAVKGRLTRKSAEAVAALAAIGPPAVEYALGRLEGTGAETKKTVLMILKKAREPQYLQRLLPLLKDEDPEVRALTGFALGDMGPEAVEPLLGILSDPNRMVRMYALKALGQTGETRTVGPLVKALREAGKDWEFQRAASESLSMIKNYEPARELFLDPDPAVRGLAIAMQRRLASYEGSKPLAIANVPLLITLLEDSVEEVRRSAAEALKEVGPPHFLPWMTLVGETELPWPEYGRSTQ